MGYFGERMGHRDMHASGRRWTIGRRLLTTGNRFVLATTLLLLFATPGWAATFSDAGFTAEVVAKLEPFSPVGLAFAPGNRIFVWEKAGVVRVVKDGTLLTTPFIDIRTQVNQYVDRGLLGLAVDPNFSTNHHVYLLYTVENSGNPSDSGPKTARLSRVTADPTNPDVALPDSEVFLLVDMPATSCCHTIGTVRFAPDGTLFVGNGEGTHPTVQPDALLAQDLDSLNGKIIRINPDGSAPHDNPFFDGTNSTRSKVWAYGLRNPFRFSLHPISGEPVIGDVGWLTWEEVNVGRGANFGWPCFEGNNPQPDYQAGFPQCQALAATAVTAPIYTYSHTDPDAFGVTGSSITGGPIYTGDQYPVQYQGNLFIADYPAGWIRRLIFDADGHLVTVVLFATGVDGPVAIEEGPDGLLYYVAFNSGEIRRIRFNGPIATASATPTSGYSPLDVTFSSAGSRASDGSALSYAWEFGDGVTSAQRNPAHTFTSAGTASFTATLTVTDGAGRTSSDSVRITVGSKPPAPSILEPRDRLIVSPGQTVMYRGAATDPDDGALDATALSWIVLLHHDTHVHILQTATGAQGSFDVTDHGEGKFSYEIVLSARDKSGLTGTQSVRLPINRARPDFAVSSVTILPVATRPGGEISVTHTIRNAAVAPNHAPRSTARILLSDNDVLDGGDLSLATVAVPKLLAGAATTFERGLQIPKETPPGRYWVFVRANDGDVVVEGGALAANNVGRTVKPILVGPDLVATAAMPTPIATAPGMKVSVATTVKNRGGQAAGAFDITVYLSTDSEFSPGVDIPIGTRRVATGLARGTMFTRRIVATIPPTQAIGKYYLVVRVDTSNGGAGEVTEANETNNTRVTVPVRVFQPDLATTALTVKPRVTAPGMTVSVTQTVKNLAALPGKAGPTTMRLFLSVDGVLEGGDVALRDIPIPALPGGATATVTRNVRIPEDMPIGTYFIVGQANAVDPIAENDPTGGLNNIRATASPIVIGPDPLVTQP